MSEKEYQSKCVNLFQRNTVLINELETANNRIAELEKENAELKEKLNIRSCQNCKHNNKSCPSDGSCKHYSEWEGYENTQLTKATEIIKRFSKIRKTPYLEGEDELFAEAEQFLSEVEK